MEQTKEQKKNAEIKKAATEKSKKGRTKLVWDLSHGYRLIFIWSIISMIIALLANYFMPQVLRFTVDSVIGDEPLKLPRFVLDMLDYIGGIPFLKQNIIICAIIAMAFSLIQGIFSYISRTSTARFSEGIIQSLRDKLYEHIQHLPYEWHTKNPTGDIIQRCTSDMEVIRNFVSMQLTEVIRVVLLVIVSLTLMFAMNVKLTLIAVAFMPITVLYSSLFFKKISHRFREADEAEGALSTMVQENFTGVRVVRAFGREAHEIEKFDQKNGFFANLWIKLGYVLSYYWSIGDFISMMQVAVVTIVGVFESINGNLTIGEYMLFVAYNSMLTWPMRSLGRILSEMSKTGVSISRINEILQSEPEKDDESALTPDMHGDIVFKDVSFDYNGIKPVLKSINLTIKKGTTFGILGRTGSGKSTLMYLLDRLYDLGANDGQITINGVDIRNIRRDHLRKNIGFVLQEPFLFSRTIKENVGIIHNDIDMRMVHRCADIAAVDESITEFTDGYETMVGERGVTLSGGQKQRVAIARMLMQDAPIMIFDDSLSAVDAETDSKIRAALKQNTHGSTVILISHRITTLMHADNIVVLDKGSVVQQGTHQELSSVDGVYKQIYEIQGTIESELQELTTEEVAADGLS